MRQAAAFGLGLLGDKAAVPALLAAAERRCVADGPRARRGSARPDRRCLGGRADRRLRHQPHCAAGRSPASRPTSSAGRSRPRPTPAARHLRAGAAQGARTCSCRRSWTPRAAAERVVADRLRAAPDRGSADARADAGPAQGERVLQRRVRRAGARVVEAAGDRGAAAARRAGVGDAAAGGAAAGRPRPRPPRRPSRDRAAGRAARRADARSGVAGRSRDRARRPEGGAGRRSAARSAGRPSPTMRGAAVTALAAIEGRGVPAGAVWRGSDPDWTVRAAVATALGLARRRGARSGVEAVSRRHRPADVAGDDEGARPRRRRPKPRRRWIACCGRA